MTAICPADDIKEDVLGESGDVGSSHIPLARRAAPGFRRGKSGRGQMSTIEVHEPEVKELQIKPSTRAAAVLPARRPRDGLGAPAEGHVFRQPAGVWRAAQAQVLCHYDVVCFNCVASSPCWPIPLMFTEELPKAQLLTFLVAPPPPPPPPPPAAAEAQRWFTRFRPTCFPPGRCARPPRIPQKMR
jgi:hypothetical protein